MTGAVYAQTNEPRNAVIVLRRDVDGGLTALRSYETGGAGTGEPHLDSQGSVVLAAGGECLLVANVASGDVTAFTRSDDGALDTLSRSRTGGAPKSVAECNGLVYVLNTASPSLVGFRLGRGGLEPVAGSDTSLVPFAVDPAQVGFTPDGSAAVVTDRGTNSIVAFPVRPDGTLGTAEVIASSGPTPYGFAFTRDGTLVVTEAFGAQKGSAAASSYSARGATITPVTRSVHNGRSEICWAVVTGDDRYAFSTNFADGAVSRYAIGSDGSLALDDPTAGISVDGRAGLRDEALSTDGRHLYAIDADAGAIVGWSVADRGTLEPLGSWGGLAKTIAGLAAY